MKERLLEFLRNENKTSAQLAEEIGVQASGISHILSGRNNPSLDFVLKMLERYKFLSSDWLLFGKGSMYTEPQMRNLFDFDEKESRPAEKINPEKVEKQIDITTGVVNAKANPSADPKEFKRPLSEVVKVLWFYDDNTFEEFFPRK
jgi:transcriptional regulator with XRE-family HTH domain